jgi:phage recombination protein Bet
MTATETAMVPTSTQAYTVGGLPAVRKVSLVAKLAERFGVEPTKMVHTLKATAFRTDKPISDEQLMALLIVADQYSLNPFTKEIFAFPDKGGIVPVVSVDGWSRIINEHPMYDGAEFVVSADGAECTATMHRKDRTHPTVITEYLAECKRNVAPWQSHPRRMLRHKALIQCARVAFGFAGIYDEDEATRIVSRDMGAADEVREPVSTSAHAVRNLLHTAEPVDVSDMHEVEAPVHTLATFTAQLSRVDDPEIAGLILDEARTVLTEAEQQALTETYRAKFQPKETP